MPKRVNPAPIRASLAPVHYNCPGSIRLYWRNQQNENLRVAAGLPALTGTVVHDLIASQLRDGSYDVDAALRRHPIDPLNEDEIGFLMWGLIGLLDEIEPHLSDPHIEVELGNEWLTGHPDLFDAQDIHAIIWDHKTSRAENTLYVYQLLAYAVLVYEQNLNIDTFYTYLAYPRLGYARCYEFTRARVQAFADELQERMLEASVPKPAHRVGKWCGICPFTAQCPAVRRIIRALPARAAKTEALAIEQLYNWIPILDRVREQFSVALKARLAAGPMTISNGKRIGLKKSERRTLDFKGARSAIMEILETHLDPEDLAGIWSTSLTDAKKLVMAKAERGQKGQVAKDLVEDLERVGAFRVTETTSITEVSDDEK